MPRDPEMRGYALRLPHPVYEAVKRASGKESMNTWITTAITEKLEARKATNAELRARVDAVLSRSAPTSSRSTSTAGTTPPTRRSPSRASRSSGRAAGAVSPTASGGPSDPAPTGTAPATPLPPPDPCGSPEASKDALPETHEHRPASKGPVTKCACGAIRVRGQWRHPAA